LSDSKFRHEPDPDNPGWMIWEITEEERFNRVLGPFRVRKESETTARCRIWPQPIHSNLSDVVHGGVVMSFIDISLFAGSRMLGILHAGRSVTLDMTCQFMVPAVLEKSLDAEVEILRETGRLVFLRGLVVQDAVKIAAFSATIRKASPPK
jgi:acyl-coenzyme A thioesterase PaaI-like protein